MSLSLNGNNAPGVNSNRRSLQNSAPPKIENAAPAEGAGNTVVKLNSVVEFKYLDEEQVATISIVMPDNADVKLRRLSVFAPISVALLGRNRGDKVEFRTANSTRTVKILNVINR